MFIVQFSSANLIFLAIYENSEVISMKRKTIRFDINHKS